MADMTKLASKIIWPCELSASFTEGLTALFDRVTDISTLKLAPKNVGFDGVTYIAEGVGSVYTYSENTKSVISAIVGPGDWVGINGIDQYESVSVFAEEITPLVVYHIDQHKLIKLQKSDSEFYKWAFYCSHNLQPNWLQQYLISHLSREIRVAYMLIEIAEKLEINDDGSVFIELSQAKLALITGLTRPRVNEVLKDMETQGVITIKRNALHILSVNKLKSLISADDLMFKAH